MSNQETEKLTKEMDEWLEKKANIIDLIVRQALIESTIKFADEEFERHLRGTGTVAPKGILSVVK